MDFQPFTTLMARKGEVLWEVGKTLPKEIWDEVWNKGECIESPKFTMPDICTLQIFFYPGGIGNSERPSFKLVRSNTTMKSRKVQGEIQLLHKDTLAAIFILDDKFERGKTEIVHGFKTFESLHRLKIFHSLPELGYRWIYTVFDPDPEETEPEVEPAPNVVSSGFNFVWSGISYMLGWDN